MRVAIYGTGGAGGYFGAHLAKAGNDVVFIARGEHLREIREYGLKIELPDGEILVNPAHAEDDPSRVGKVDVILFGVKTWQLPAAARSSTAMLGPETFAVPLQNGVEAPASIASALGRERVLGGLCGTIDRVVAPGVIRSVGPINFVKFGELDNSPSERTARLQRTFEEAGVRAEVPPDIHVAMWEKFVFVAPYGGVGAVTRAPVGVIRQMPETRRMLEDAVAEAVEVGQARGIDLADDTLDRTMALVDALAPDATTSLQRDIMNGRPSELEAWSGAVVRLGNEAAVPTPLNTLLYHSLLPSERRARGEVIFPE